MALVTPRRFEGWLVSLDPTVGNERRKTRLCVVVSPDEMNGRIRTVIVAPMTSAGRGWPTRVALRFEERDGEVALDQLRRVDRRRLVRRLGALEAETARAVVEVLGRMFAW